MWCRGRIDRKRNSTINLTTDSGACYLCFPQISPLTPDVTTNIFFHSAAGNAKIYLKNYNIIPRLTLLMETFIHTYHRSFTVLSDKSIYTVSLPGNFLTSWTLPFLGHFLFLRDLIFFFFLWGPLSISPSSVRGSPTHRYNSVDLRTRLPGCVDHQVCSTYVSTPQGQPSGPGPGCYLSLAAPR